MPDENHEPIGPGDIDGDALLPVLRELSQAKGAKALSLLLEQLTEIAPTALLIYYWHHRLDLLPETMTEKPSAEEFLKSPLRHKLVELDLKCRVVLQAANRAIAEISKARPDLDVGYFDFAQQVAQWRRCGFSFTYQDSVESMSAEFVSSWSSAGQGLRDRIQQLIAVLDSEGVAGGGTEPATTTRRWTQRDVDAEIRNIKVRHASQYSRLCDGVAQGSEAAGKAARELFGRNALARTIGCSQAMVTESPAWKAIKADLKLEWGKDKPSKKIGLDMAVEQKAEDVHQAAMRENRDVYEDDQGVDRELYQKIGAYRNAHPEADETAVAKALGCTVGDVEQYQTHLERLMKEQSTDMKKKRLRAGP